MGSGVKNAPRALRISGVSGIAARFVSTFPLCRELLTSTASDSPVKGVGPRASAERGTFGKLDCAGRASSAGIRQADRQPNHWGQRFHVVFAAIPPTFFCLESRLDPAFIDAPGAVRHSPSARIVISDGPRRETTGLPCSGRLGSITPTPDSSARSLHSQNLGSRDHTLDPSCHTAERGGVGVASSANMVTSWRGHARPSWTMGAGSDDTRRLGKI